MLTATPRPLVRTRRSARANSVILPYPALSVKSAPHDSFDLPCSSPVNHVTCLPAKLLLAGGALALEPAILGVWYTQWLFSEFECTVCSHLADRRPTYRPSSIVDRLYRARASLIAESIAALMIFEDQDR